jgi:hypothetical protein
MKKTITILVILLVAVLIYWVFFVFNFAGFKNGKIIVNRNLCEDNCPEYVEQKSWKRVYFGIKDIDECKAVGGEVIPSYAWRIPFRACGVK